MPNQEDLKQHLVSLLLPFAKRNVPNEEKLRNELVVVLDHLLGEEKYSDWSAAEKATNKEAVLNEVLVISDEQLSEQVMLQTKPPSIVARFLIAILKVPAFVFCGVFWCMDFVTPGREPSMKLGCRHFVRQGDTDIEIPLTKAEQKYMDGVASQQLLDFLLSFRKRKSASV